MHLAQSRRAIGGVRPHRERGKARIVAVLFRGSCHGGSRQENRARQAVVRRALLSLRGLIATRLTKTQRAVGVLTSGLDCAARHFHSTV